MSLNSTSATGFLKDTYLPGYINQYENAQGTLLGLFYKDRAAMTIEGANAFLKVRVGDSLGQGTIAEGGDYPTAGDVTSAQATVTAAHLAHSINLTSEEAAYLDSGSAAAEPIIAMKMDAAMETMARDMERQSYGDGTGILANVASSSGSTITLDSTTATVQVDRDRYIWLDDTNRRRYDVVHGTTGADEVAGFTVSNIVESTNVLTCSATMTSATSAGVLVNSGDWASGGAFRSLEFDGLQSAIADDNTYLGIDRTAAGNGYWQAVIDAGASSALRDIDEATVMGFMAKMARRRTDGKQVRGSDYMALANSGSWNAYHGMLLPAQRYSAETPELGWGQPLNFRGVLLYEDIHCPRNGFMVIHKPSIKYVKARHAANVTGDLLKFKELGGQIWFQGNAASGSGHSAQVFAYLEGFIGMATFRPRNHGWLKDITEVGSAY